MKSLARLLPLALLGSTLMAQPSATSNSANAESPNSPEVNAVFGEAKALYLDLHQHPELSSHETETAAKLSAKLRALGYEVTEHVGGTGIVAILKNGAGPTVMLRTELDALPVEEKTGLPYASKVRTKDDKGNDVGVMQACGHDLHMSSLYGTAAIMAKTKSTWHGTLMLIGQPAEETITGARAMLEDGLFKRFPKPDIGLALHDTNLVPAGRISMRAGFEATNADSLKVTIYGKGGHGSAPDATIDPILIAAKTIESLQSIVSREVHPGEMAVVTVGYIHGGTKNNIIPDSVEMGLTVRSYKPDVRAHVLKAIARIVAGEGAAAGVEKMPTIDRYEYTDAVVNDAGLVERLRPALENALGKENVEELPPNTGSEDYSYFVNAGVPSVYFDLGAAEPKNFADAKATGRKLPTLHSSLFAPDVDPALHTGIAAEVTALRALLK
jgi:amidohydrolase